MKAQGVVRGHPPLGPRGRDAGVQHLPASGLRVDLDEDLVDALYSSQAQLHGMIEKHVGPPRPLIGGRPVGARGGALLEKTDAAFVLVDGKPAGILTWQDLLALLGGDRDRRSL